MAPAAQQGLAEALEQLQKPFLGLAQRLRLLRLKLQGIVHEAQHVAREAQHEEQEGRFGAVQITALRRTLF